MPKLILAAAALLLDRPRPARDDAPSAMQARTRSREAARRLRASRVHEASLNLRALDLTMRH